MIKICRLLLIAILILLVCSPLSSQEKNEEGSVQIPWEEFRKLLELDKDEIVLSWQEFQKILEQTGFQYVPPFQLKEERVILTRSQFKRLLDQMKPPEITTVQPPSEFLLTKAAYRGRISSESASFRTSLDVEIFPKQRPRFIKIPLFPVNVALRDVLFDGKRALVLLEGNRHTLTTDDSGHHQITVDFSLKTTTNQGPWALSFPVPQTAITILEVDIPFTDISVEVGNSQQVEVSERANLTHISALLSPTNSIDIKWRKKPKEVVKGPAKVYADTLNHVSIDDDALRVTTEVSLSVLQNTISSITLRVPEGYSILDVKGNGVGDWRELIQKEALFLEIPFEYPKQGGFNISVMSEKLLQNENLTVDFSGFAVEDAIREKGFIGVELKSTSEVTLVSSEGLDKLDVSELPPNLIMRSQKPLLFGFKYLHHPYSLVLDVKKHDEIPVISTVVDSASGVTLFTEDGKLVHRVVYKIRNTSKQFLELDLPDEAQIWSVFVGGEPTKPRLNRNKILIPLNRSSQGATGLAAFDVELIYFEKGRRFSWLGKRGSLFPVPDIIISQMLWSVYLPEGYDFLYFGGTVEKEKIAQGLRPLLGAKRKAASRVAGAPAELGTDEEGSLQEALKMKKEFSPNLALEEDKIAEQVRNEAQFGQRVQDIQTGKIPAAQGVLPIRIHIPTTGQLYRFAKTIVSDEPLSLSFGYISGETLLLFKIIFILLILTALFGLRRRIKKAFLSLRNNYKAGYTPFLLILLALILWALSKALSIICLVAALALLVLMRFRRQA
ncbi:MAG: hypothetical protein JXB23_11310 [Candidatus Aminicenantes bacterium]|nr:hypothetical protein [Candidatus Aminicenantes bacterium]